jgi:DNA-directed RNA polymerase subunit L
MYNVVSTCCYGNTEDKIKITDVWNEKRKELEKNKLSEEDIENEKKNWLLLEAKRIFVPNSFDFTIETIGIYSNMQLIVKACDIMIKKCKTFMENIKDKESLVEYSENTLLKNEFTVTLENEDYTFGNVLTYFLYKEYYENKKEIDFVGFQKPHPHIPNSKIRINLVDSQDKNKIYQYLNDSCEEIIIYYSNLSSLFNQNK